MGTSKRERQKAGHQARLNVERSMARRDQRRRRLFTIVGAAVMVVATAALFVALSDNSSTSTTAATNDNDACEFNNCFCSDASLGSRKALR